MSKKPVISLLRGNMPTVQRFNKRTVCWRCSDKIAKNDKVFDVPGPARFNPKIREYYREHKQYCVRCMRDNINHTENKLNSVKKYLE